jgi:hypothetical protein
MNKLLRVDAPAVHRGTLFRYIVRGSGNDGSLNGNCWMNLMITVVVTRAIVVSKGVLLAV